MESKRSVSFVHGKNALITGATSGIGLQMAISLAAMGANLIIAARSISKADDVVKTIHKSCPMATISVVRLDLNSFSSVREAARHIKATFSAVHLLVANAGLMVMGSKPQLTQDKFEMHFQCNYLSHFLLIRELEGLLIASAPARVVITASRIHSSGHIGFEDYNFTKPETKYGMMRAYAHSKFAVVLATYELNRRLSPHGVTVNCCHPGIIRSNIFTEFVPAWVACWLWPMAYPFMAPWMKTTKRGAKASLRLATSPEFEGRGGIYTDSSGDPVASSAPSREVKRQQDFYALSCLLTGTPEATQLPPSAAATAAADPAPGTAPLPPSAPVPEAPVPATDAAPLLVAPL
ncbi:putative short chain dehydrogenase [Paratrimastix pyriformis]|uniref:Short chain dehydrogenase n=1 Tax=Paratrimastix pyriformis TaxID=342808 RepID=A0ABQ8UZY4_9EUKA|nr:putative short chain dehydrogenase [Paratrimastix pyriformis]